TVFVDANGDGVPQPGEPGLAGVAVTLGGTDDQGHPVGRTTTTGAGGSYGFAGLRPGTYTLTEGQPGGYSVGTARAGTAGGHGGTAAIIAIRLAPGVGATGYDFGAQGATLAGSVVITGGGAGGLGGV